jgi:hypothetical protein
MAATVADLQQALDELRRRAARVVNEWHDDDLSSDSVSHLAELVPAELLPCDCGGQGWFVMVRDDTGQLEIQRCDDCAVLTDEEAQALPEALEALHQAEEEASAAEMLRRMRRPATVGHDTSTSDQPNFMVTVRQESVGQLIVRAPTKSEARRRVARAGENGWEDVIPGGWDVASEEIEVAGPVGPEYGTPVDLPDEPRR